jgi:putative Holliday junction resolvase
LASATGTGTQRILGVDYGAKRIGLSLSDPLQILATSYRALDNSPSVWRTLAEIVAKEEVELIVVGMPVTLKGEKGKKAQEVEEFMTELRAHVHVPVVHWDERFTTSIAQRTRLSMGTKRSDRRHRDGSLDAMAAAVMLQGFLDSRKNSICS